MQNIWSGIVKSGIVNKFNRDCRQVQIEHRWTIFFAPVLIIALLLVLLAIPVTKPATQWLLYENRPVELLTFAFALLAAFEGFKFAQKQARKKNRFLRLFYLLFALFFFFFAMEEIAWGQQFLNFSTPEFWRIRNAQDELTLHNYSHPAFKHLEVYPLVAGILGLTGIWANLANWLPKRICPPLILCSWFAVITLHSGIDLSHEFYIFSAQFDEIINHLDEAAEMLVAMSGLLFVYFNSRRLSG